MDELNRRVYSLVHARLDSAGRAAIRNQYRVYREQYDWMFGYIATIFAINCTHPPVIQPMTDALRAYGDSTGNPDTWSLNRMMELEAWAADLSRFYVDAGLEEAMEVVRPAYDSIGAAYRDQAVRRIGDAIEYTGVEFDDLGHIQKIVIIPNLLGPQGEMGPEYRGIKYDIKGPKSQVVFYAHEFLHSIVHPMLQSPDIEKQIARIVESRMGRIDSTKAWKSYPEPSLFFEECLVRALDARIMNAGEQDADAKIRKNLDFEESRGFIFCGAISSFLEGFERRDGRLEEEVGGLLIELSTL
ncbi:MAG: DUF4932 domain-containing protein [Bacteroidales bacterium]